MLTRATHFPDPLVRITPDLSQVVQENGDEVRPKIRCSKSAAPSLIVCIQHLTVDIELALIRCGIADSHGCRALISWKPGQDEFRQPPLAGDTVHDLSLRRETRDRALQPQSPILSFLI